MNHTHIAHNLVPGTIQIPAYNFVELEPLAENGEFPVGDVSLVFLIAPYLISMKEKFTTATICFTPFDGRKLIVNSKHSLSRRSAPERLGWKAKVENMWVPFHTHPTGERYWNEGTYYAFRQSQVDVLKRATNDIYQMVYQAIDRLISEDRLGELGIPEHFHPLIKLSWETDDVGIIGRLDFSYDGINPPKLLEYNADTPMSLVEACPASWEWLQDVFPHAKQWNEIYERGIEAFKRLQGFLPENFNGKLHFFYEELIEDKMTALFLAEMAKEAGYKCILLDIQDVGWNPETETFYDLDEEDILVAVKTYPWEHIWRDKFGVHAAQLPRKCVFLEPAWKIIPQSKAFLAMLWEMFPKSPYLLPTYLDGPRELVNTGYAKKPIFAREGGNITIVRPGMSDVKSLIDNPAYGKEGYVYQACATLPCVDSNYVLIGCWVIDGEAAGMGIRETDHMITDKRARFVPHAIFPDFFFTGNK